MRAVDEISRRHTGYQLNNLTHDRKVLEFVLIASSLCTFLQEQIRGKTTINDIRKPTTNNTLCRSTCHPTVSSLRYNTRGRGALEESAARAAPVKRDLEGSDSAQ